MTDRETHIHCARVYLAQAAAFRARPERHNKRFAVVLGQWAARARRAAMAMPRQQEFFR